MHTAINKGNEANVYLTYIIEHYHRLPSTIVFVHSHEKGFPSAWHTDAPDHSNVHSIQALNIDFVQRTGYANLRCIANPGCDVPFRPMGPVSADVEQEVAFADTWQYLFQSRHVPQVVGATCCSQFAVSRDQIRMRPLEFYVRAHGWLMMTELSDSVSGRVFEYMWHIVFGREPLQ